MTIKELYESTGNNNKSIMLYFRKEEYYLQLIKETNTLPNDISKSERFYCWLHGITEIPKCPFCGKNRRWKDMNSGYFATCGDKECKSEGIRVGNKSSKRDYIASAAKARETYKARTGYEHNMQNPEFKKKFFEDYKEKHNGESCGVQSEKAIKNREKTFREKYNGSVRAAFEQGMIAKYGSVSECSRQNIKNLIDVSKRKSEEDFIELISKIDEMGYEYISNENNIFRIRCKRCKLEFEASRQSINIKYRNKKYGFCPICDYKASWKGRGVKTGYYEICGCKECRSKQLTDSHSGSKKISQNRDEKFLKWEKTVTEINDDVVKEHIKYDKYASMITNPIILDYLNNRFADSDSLVETLQRIRMGGVEEKPECELPGCHNHVTWIGRKRALFSRFCCPAHSAQCETTRMKCSETVNNKYKK